MIKKEVKKEEKETEERVFVTLFANGKNIAVDLVKAGLAYVTKHRNDEERSSYYDRLMAAEIDAKSKNKGIHAERRNPDIYRINDISFGDEAKSKQYLPSLKDRRLKGVVEKVHSGTRMKVWVEKQSLLITFALSGVSAPSVKKNLKPGEKQKPYALESREFTNKNLVLQQVEIIVDFCDKFGTFLGNLYLKNNQNFGCLLLSKGFGYTNGSARRLDNANALFAAEKVASDAKLNLMGLTEKERDLKAWERKQKWEKEKNAERESRNSRNRDSLVASKNRSPINVRVTEVVDATHVYLQTSSSSKVIEEIEEVISSLDLTNPVHGYEPRSGDIALCQFSLDGNWYRAKIQQGVDSKGCYSVFYMDYGNSEKVKAESLRPCTDKKLVGFPEQAKEAFLAFVDTAPKQYKTFAEDFVKDFLFDRDLSAIHEYTDRKSVYLTIFDEDNKNLNKELIRSGLAFVTKNEKISRAFKDSLGEYNDAEEYAIMKRNYLWEKGEIYGSDGEDN